MPKKSLVETFIKHMMEDDRERAALEKLKKDSRFQKLLKNLQQIDDELDVAVKDIVKKDPELRKLFSRSGADWRDVYDFRD